MIGRFFNCHPAGTRPAPHPVGVIVPRAFKRVVRSAICFSIFRRHKLFIFPIIAVLFFDVLS